MAFVPLCLVGWHFLQKGGPIYKTLASIKLRPLHFGNKNFMTPHHRHTLPPKQAKIVLKSVFLNKTNTISGHLVIPYILVIKNFMTSPIFLSKNLWPPVYDTIKGNESDVGNIGFELQAKRGDKFLCFTLFLNLKKCSYLCNQMSDWDGVRIKM